MIEINIAKITEQRALYLRNDQFFRIWPRYKNLFYRTCSIEHAFLIVIVNPYAMKYILLLLIIPILFSCKKDSPKIDTTPVLEIKWTNNGTRTVIKTYVSGTLTSTREETTGYDDKDTWEFTKSGQLMSYFEDREIGKTTYVRKGDSLIIEPGTIFAGQVRAKMTEFTKTDMSLLYIGASNGPNHVDSFFTTLKFYTPTK